MATCNYCTYDKELIKAHIYPKKLYNPMKDSFQDSKPADRVPYAFSKDGSAKQWQNGIYDENILCGCCDKLLGYFDEHGQSVLKNIREAEGDVITLKKEDFNYNTFKLFFLSILWRASISNLPFFDKIKLGHEEPLIKEMLIDNNSGNPDLYSVIITKRKGEYRFIMEPPWNRWGRSRMALS